MPRDLTLTPDDTPIAEQLERRLLHSLRQHLPDDRPAGQEIRQRIDPQGFREFTEDSWRFNEARPYVHNWHIDSITDHVFALINGDLPTSALLITVPPASMKSYLVGVLSQAYAWGPGQMPWMRFMNISYGHGLAKRDSLRFRNIAGSRWYSERWPDARPRHDQNEKTRIENIRGGWRFATSIGGSATGDHPDVIVIDDALKADDANSQTIRLATNEWLGDTITTRGVSRDVKVVMACQRLAPEDPPYWFLQAFPDAVHLNIPMEFDPQHPVRDPSIPTPAPCNWIDPRTEPGELLWPDLINRDKVERIKRAFVHRHKAAAQLQQAPTAQAGELIMRDWFQFLDVMPQEPVVSTVRGWDLASTEGGGDFTAGCMVSKLQSGRYVIQHVTRGQWGPGKRDHHIRQTAECDGTGVRIALERAGNAGREQVAGIARVLSGFKVQGVPVGRAGKLERADGLISQLQSGNLFLLRGPWNSAFVDEMCAFPSGIHDDQVDAASIAFNHLASQTRKFLAAVAEAPNRGRREPGDRRGLFGGFW